jgi:hypothetical protein
MKCLLCGQKSPIEAKMDQFPLSERVRKMLEREFGIGNPDRGMLDNGVCRECLALPPADRNKLAASALKIQKDEELRDLIKRAFQKMGN